MLRSGKIKLIRRYKWLAVLLDSIYAEGVYSGNRLTKADTWDILIQQNKLLSYKIMGYDMGLSPTLFNRD